ncbi:MAG: hypothetical protein COA94_02970 [Rickettsiales bacterium]|nr:MAG: hypothetical protein COA94_02970 [Rickettsiales bacterium]
MESPKLGWTLPTLYSMDQNNSIRLWNIEFDSKCLVTKYGMLNGKIQSASVEIYSKCNRTLDEQALLEASNKYNKKIRNGYGVDVNACINSCNTLQLANKYIIPGSLTAKGNAIASNVKCFPVLLQPKIDGIRCKAFMKGGNLMLMSRNNKKHSFLDHIKEDVRRIISLVGNRTLDGELYNGDMSFVNIQSSIMCSKTKSPSNEKIQYWIFDVVDYTLDVKSRLKLLDKAKVVKSKHIVFVPSIEAVSHEDISKKHRGYVIDGYEGTMIRHIAKEGSKYHKMSLYRGKRNNNLLKHKDFLDEEGEVISISEGRGKFKGAAIIRLIDPRGNELEVTPKGTFEHKTELYTNRNKYIGKLYKYKYQGLSEYGIPRFPIGLYFIEK